jgi:hypothetical protein
MILLFFSLFTRIPLSFIIFIIFVFLWVKRGNR